MAFEVRDKTKYILTSGGVVVEPYVEFDTPAECSQWVEDQVAAGELLPGDYRQFVQTIISYVVEVPE